MISKKIWVVTRLTSQKSMWISGAFFILRRQGMRDLVIQTDFGLKDGAVSTMYGVAYGVSDKIRISELT